MCFLRCFGYGLCRLFLASAFLGGFGLRCLGGLRSFILRHSYVGLLCRLRCFTLFLASAFLGGFGLRCSSLIGLCSHLVDTIQRKARLHRLNGAVRLVVIGFQLLLHLVQLLFLGAYGSQHTLALEVGGVDLSAAVYATGTLTLSRFTGCLTRFLFGLYDGGAVVRLCIQDGITDFSYRLIATRVKTHRFCYLTDGFERHSLQFL